MRGLGGISIDMSSGTADEAADRALSSVARKLNKTLSVEYTVNELIAEATDPIHLATIYYGLWLSSLLMFSMAQRKNFQDGVRTYKTSLIFN